MKTCTKCGEEKALTEFYRDSSKKDGIRRECKECTNKTNSLYRKNNVEKRRFLGRRWRENNREKCNAASSRWAKRNPEKIREKACKYQKANPEKIIAYVRKYQKANPENVLMNRAKQILRRTGTPETPENVELVKTRIKLKRIIKQLEK